MCFLHENIHRGISYGLIKIFFISVKTTPLTTLFTLSNSNQKLVNKRHLASFTSNNQHKEQCQLNPLQLC